MEPDTTQREQITVETIARDIGEMVPETRPGCLTWSLLYGATLALFVGMGNGLGSDGYLIPWLTGGVAAGILGFRLLSLARTADSAGTALRCTHLGPESIGALIESLEWPNRRVRAVARWCLVRLLPTLKPEDADLLTPVQMASLYDSLTPYMAQSHPEFVEAVLAAVRAVGGEGAPRAVGGLARMPGWTRRLRHISSLARAALPVVEWRVATSRTPRTSPDGSAAAGAASAAEVPGATGSDREEKFAEALSVQPQMRLAFLLASWLVIVPYGVWGAARMAAGGEWLMALPFAALAATGTQLYRLTLLSRHARLARELMREEDKAAIGRLAEAACWPDARIKAAAMASLTRLLPRLQASEARLLRAEHRSCLYATLNRATALQHPEYVVALLTALEQVGDLAAVPFVKALAEAPESSARIHAVRKAARECLPALLERAQLNTDHQTLLRPAAAPGMPHETLLRPAQSAPNCDDGLLVRPAPHETVAPDG